MRMRTWQQDRSGRRYFSQHRSDMSDTRLPASPNMKLWDNTRQASRATSQPQVSPLSKSKEEATTDLTATGSIASSQSSAKPLLDDRHVCNEEKAIWSAIMDSVPDFAEMLQNH